MVKVCLIHLWRTRLEHIIVAYQQNTLFKKVRHKLPMIKKRFWSIPVGLQLANHGKVRNWMRRKLRSMLVEIRLLREDYMNKLSGLFRKLSWYFKAIVLYFLTTTPRQLSRGKYHWIFLFVFVIMWRILEESKINWAITIWRNLPKTPSFINSLFSFWLRDFIRRSLITKQGYL